MFGSNNRPRSPRRPRRRPPCRPGHTIELAFSRQRLPSALGDRVSRHAPAPLRQDLLSWRAGCIKEGVRNRTRWLPGGHEPLHAARRGRRVSGATETTRQSGTFSGNTSQLRPLFLTRICREAVPSPRGADGPKDDLPDPDRGARRFAADLVPVDHMRAPGPAGAPSARWLNSGFTC